MLLLSFKDLAIDMALRSRRSGYYIFCGLEKEYIVIPRNRISSGLGMTREKLIQPGAAIIEPGVHIQNPGDILRA